jgi:WD40 repeat protein/transcriptional regulator with XRE-family HTH domain
MSARKRGSNLPPHPTDPDAVGDRQQFADALKQVREYAGLTVRDLARATGVPHSTIGGYLSGRHLPPVSQPDLLPEILRACGIEDGHTLERWRQSLARVRRHPAHRSTSATPPYVGLASFQPEDADWFFGRHHLTKLVVERMAERRAGGGGPVALVGPSGSGKSSLLRAGVIPALRDGALAVDGTDPWPVLLFHPGARPLRALATHLSGGTGDDADAFAESLRAQPQRCSHLARRAAAAGHGEETAGGLVIVVDQFEEVFTECTDDTERRLFLAALHAAATPPQDPGDTCLRPAAAVLVGLRADFYHRALREPLLVTSLQQAQVAIGPMNESELREAIVAPARRAGLEVEEGLVEVLLRDLAPPAGDDEDAHEAGALPLLAHALRATWERGNGRRLTVADYEATGGVRGAVARTADRVFDSLTPAEQEVAQRLLVRLVRVGDDTPNTRRRLARQELGALLGGPGANLLDDVLDRFVERRLITVDAETVEIVHEALVVAWPRLRRWIEADRRGLLIAQRVDDDACRWHRDGRDPAMLYQGARLAAVQGWAESTSHRELTRMGREFLQASTRRERRRVRALHQTVAALAALLLLAVIGGTYAVQQRSEAVAQRAAAAEERNLALSRMVAVRADRMRGSDPALAGQLALAAYGIAPTAEARSSLLSASAAPAVTRMLGPNAIMQDIAYHPGRNLLVGASDDRASVLMWDVTDRYRPILLDAPMPGLDGVINTVALHPDGLLLAAGSSSGTIFLYDLTAPRAPAALAPLTGPDAAVRAVTFSPDGRTLAAGGHAGTVTLWNVSGTGGLTGPAAWIDAATDAVTSVAFSPDGRTLAVGGHDTVVYRYDVSDPATPAPLGIPLTGPEREVLSVAFSPDTTTLAAGSADGNVYLWPTSGDPPEPGQILAGPSGSGPAHSVAFGPDGRTMATGSEDGDARLWDLASGQVTAKLPHPGRVTALVVEPDGEAIITAAADGVLRRWTPPGPVLRAATGTVQGLVHHPDAPVVIGASGDGHLYFWDVTDQQQPALIAGPLASTDQSDPLVGKIAISPDGQLLAAAGHLGSLWRWDVSDPRRPVIAGPPLAGPATTLGALSFDGTGTLLAAGDSDGVIHLWKVGDRSRPLPLPALTDGPDNVYAVAFSPDGQLLAAGGVNRMVWMWDVSDPERPLPFAPLTGPDRHIDTLAFSPDGAVLVVGSADETVRIYDVTEPDRPVPGPVLTGPSGSVQQVAFAPDGHQLAAAIRDHTIWQWDLTDPHAPTLYAVLTGPEGGVNTVAYDPDGHILAASSSDTTVRLFYTDVDHAAALVCAVAGDPVTPLEWEQHVPGLPYRPPC